MRKVKKLIEAGSSITAAIKEALAQNGVTSVADFAEKYDLLRPAVSNHLNGNVRATEETLDALIKELGGTRDEWRELLWLAAKPEKASA